MSGLWSQAWPVLWLTLQISGTAVLLAALLGIPLGCRVGLARPRWRRPLSVLIHTGMALPPVVVGLVLYLLLSRSGPLAFLDWLFQPAGMVAAQTVLALPFVLGIVISAVGAVPEGLAPQLRTLGATPGQVRRLVLREAGPGLLLAVAAAFGRSISEVGAVLLVGGNIAGHTRVLTTAIILETGKGNFGLALLLGGLLLSLALAVNFALLLFYERSRLHR